MGMLSQLMSAEQAHGRGPLDWLLGAISGKKVTSGVRVNATTAMNYSACWAAKRLITETIATLPRVMYKQVGSKKSPAIGHPTYKMFRSEPNIRQGGVNHHAQQFGYLVDWGNCFAEKVVDPIGRSVQTYPIHPSRVPKEGVTINPDDGTLTYKILNDKLPPTYLHQSEMFHVPGIHCDDDLWGKGVIAHAAESIGMGIAVEQYGASHFGNGGGPSIVLTHPKSLGETGAENLRRSWQKRHSGPDKANGLLVLEEDTKVSHLSFPPEANQFLQTRQFNITEIARWYNVPPHLLRELSKSSFNNIESESLHFILISIMPWLIRYEDECNRQLLIEEDKSTYFFKFLLQGMLRGDQTARAAFYKAMFEMGVYSINDILELEDRNPIGEMGDLRFVPMNFSTLENAFSPPQLPAAPVASSQDNTDTESYNVGDRVTVKPNKEHDSMTKGKTGTIKEISTPALGIQFDGMSSLHKWYTDDEVKSADGDPVEDTTDSEDTADGAKAMQNLFQDLTRLAMQHQAANQPTIVIPDTKTATETEITKTTLATAAQSVLSSTISDMIWYEGKKAAREAQNSRTFEAWCASFYDDKFKALFADKVRPMLAASTAFGVTLTAEELTSIHCDQSRADLLALLSTPNKEFVSAVQTTVDNWESRAITEAAMVFTSTKGNDND